MGNFSQAPKEARANDVWIRQDGPVNPVICTYDLTRFTGEIVVDVMRTHPMVIIGGILQENPFFVPPDEFLEQLRQRRTAKEQPVTPAAAKTEHTADEAKDLKACINDLICILAMPAIWSGGEPNQIVTALLDVLLGMLRLDFVYAVLRIPTGDAPFEIIRLIRSRDSTAESEAISQALNSLLKVDPHTWPSVLQTPTGDGDLSLASFRLGLKNEMGVLVAGSRRTDFPTRTERLLLNVAANQAAIGLQEARLLREQRHVAEELDRTVAQRTEELDAFLPHFP